MLKQVTVNIIVDDHEPEKCGINCKYYNGSNITVPDKIHWCKYCRVFIHNDLRCKQCLKEAK